MKRVLYVSVAAAALSVAGAGVQAQACQQTGTDVSCAAGLNGPFSSSDNDLTVTVQDGATVTDGNDALELTGDDVTVRNRGDVVSTGARGIDGGDGLTVRNGQASDATLKMISGDSDAVRAGDDFTLRNHGQVTGGDEAIQADDRADIVNGANGILEATDKGIQVGDDLSLDNRGEIRSGSEGIEAGDDADIENRGLIFAYEDAVQIQSGATITNTGSIVSSGGLAQSPAGADPVYTTEGDGIDIDDGAIFNNGSASLIEAANGAGIDFDGNLPTTGDDDGTGDALIYNEGTIRGLQGILVETTTDAANGDYANTSSQDVVNLGLIEGTGGTALNLGGGADSLVMYEQSMIKGQTLFGGGDDLLYLASLNYSQDSWEELFDGGAGVDDIRFAFGLSRLLGIEDHALGTRLILQSLEGTAPSAADTGTPQTFDLLLSRFETASFDNGDGSFTTISLAAAVVPLPATALLLGGALAGIGALRRRKG